MNDSATRQCCYRERQIICQQGEEADCLYVLRSGRVGVVVVPDMDRPTSADLEAHGETVAVIAEPGAVVGEGGAFLHRRTASVVALERNTVLEAIPISGGSIERAMSMNATLGMTLCRNLAARLAAVTEEVCTVANAASDFQQRVEELAARLAHLIDRTIQLARDMPAVLQRVDTLSEHPLYLLGASVKRSRSTTGIFFRRAAGGPRSGLLRLREGDLLISRGEMGRACYLLRKGHLTVTAAETTLRRIHPGEVVGEIALILKETPRRTATVRAATEAVVQCVSVVQFHELAEKQPAFLVPFARSLAARLETTDRLLCLKRRDRQAARDVARRKSDEFGAALKLVAEAVQGWPDGQVIRESAERLMRQAEVLASSLPDEAVSGSPR